MVGEEPGREFDENVVPSEPGLLSTSLLLSLCVATFDLRLIMPQKLDRIESPTMEKQA